MAPAEARDIEDPVSAEVMVGRDLLRDPAATITDLMALVKIIEHQMGTAARRMTGTGSQRASMRTDSEIRADIIRELQWDPQVAGANVIGVAVQDGAVVLTGNVGGCAEKAPATKAATRVYGVTAVADEITVQLSGESRDDADIAQDFAHILAPNTQVPAGKIHARVQRGWVRRTTSISAARSSAWSATSAARSASPTTSLPRHRLAPARFRPRSRKHSGARRKWMPGRSASRCTTTPRPCTDTSNSWSRPDGVGDRQVRCKQSAAGRC
ncbi:MAG TPA: BON domain-containing protein [Streptosporangiaceae bacterium]|jgi:osmotically-inducible protein OsmY